MRFCYCCHEAKEDSEFNKLRPGDHNGWCKQCKKDYTLEERKMNRIKFIYGIVKDSVKESK